MNGQRLGTVPPFIADNHFCYQSPTSTASGFESSGFTSLGPDRRGKSVGNGTQHAILRLLQSFSRRTGYSNNARHGCNGGVIGDQFHGIWPGSRHSTHFNTLKRRGR
jgi:hypothetical protein